MFFARDHIAEQAGALVPYPWGHRKEAVTLESYQATPPRAVFGNPAVAFPRTIAYGRPEPGRLRIEVSGTMNGKPVVDRYDRRRVDD